MSEQFINITHDNIDSEHTCCALGDKKHQLGVDIKKECMRVYIMKSIFRMLER